MRRFALVATAALLTACQPTTPNNEVASAPEPAAPAQIHPPVTAPTPASMPATPPKAERDYRSELRLTGTEPFWGVHITAGQIKLMRPDHADVTVTNAGPTINADVAVWNARGLTIRLQPGQCSDGMSNNVYPYGATVTVDGEVLKGCAARADEWPKGEG